MHFFRCYVTNEQEKRRAYDERVKEVEKACFSPVVFSASSGMGSSAVEVCHHVFEGTSSFHASSNYS